MSLVITPPQPANNQNRNPRKGAKAKARKKDAFKAVLANELADTGPVRPTDKLK